jgi:hypothetical protein
VTYIELAGEQWQLGLLECLGNMLDSGIRCIAVAGVPRLHGRDYAQRRTVHFQEVELYWPVGSGEDRRFAPVDCHPRWALDSRT